MEKLSTLCISCIVENFNKFMFTYESGNYIPKAHFEYLQRAYSVPLLEKMLGTNEWKNYMNFLLNPYLGEINLRKATGDITLIINRLIDISPTITSLHLPNSDYNNSCLVELVSSLSNVQSLTVDGQNISSHVFESIGNNCCNLKTLILSCDGVTDEHIEAFYINDKNDISEPNFSKVLQHLHFENTNNVTTRSLKYVLKNFEGMLSLKHHDVFHAIYELHAGDLKNKDLNSVRTYKLQELVISDIEKYPVEFLEFCFSLFPHLAILRISGVISQVKIDAVKIFSALEEVTLAGFCDWSSVCESIGNDLKALNIWGGIVSLSSLSKFCPKLKYLDIAIDHGLTVKDDISIPCYSFKYCKDLVLRMFNLKENIDGLSAKCILSFCPNLENLEMHCCIGLNFDFVHFLTSQKCVKTLKILEFNGTIIEFLALKFIIENAPNLERISFIFHCFTAEEMESLKLLNPFITINF